MLPKPNTCWGCELFERPIGKSMGYVPFEGTGTSGVLVIAEAAGEWEEHEGRPLVGKSGYTLFQELSKVEIVREGLMLHNVLSCRPPDNKFDKPYIPLAVAQCAPNLDASILRIKQVAKANGKTPVIITLGVPAFKRVLGFDAKRDANLLKKDYYAYPFWSDKYGVWVFNAPHPAYLVRGKTHYWSVVQFVFQRAIEVANGGLQLDEPDYLLDPRPAQFDEWVDAYLATLLLDPSNALSYDIETPYKKKKGEDELGKDEEIDEDVPQDHIILRISFAYEHPKTKEISTVSIKWSAEFMSGIETLFARAPFVLGWNSDQYDFPRVSRYVKVNGIGLDGMVAWHILNTSLDMALGFVTPYYWKHTTMWKHMADDQPAFYNAKDSDAALRCFIGIKADLQRGRLWEVYERHWIELNKALRFMSGTGVLRDNVMRSESEALMSQMLDEIEGKMEAAVPQAAKELKLAKVKPRKDLETYREEIRDIPQKVCSTCGLMLPKRWKKHPALCGGEPIDLPFPNHVWVKELPFKVSKKRMTSYQATLKHQAVINRKEKKTTFDADAIALLVKRYPSDPLYPMILEHRKINKLLGTYIGYTLENGRLHGGMPTGSDGRIHTVYGRNASTLRFTSREPNLQNLPRGNPKDPSDLANIIRNLVIAKSGSVLYARDFSGIEAVLTGYFSLDPRYIRLAKRDVHTYYTVYALYELEGGARIKAADLPDLDWPDDRLFPYLEQLKGEFKADRNNLYKHLVHAANFMQGAKGAQEKIFSETGIAYPIQTVQKVMDVYYALFPKIKVWHRTVLDEAAKDNYLRNPFDYVHRFNRVYDWKKECGQWVKKPGPDANAAIAFKPQSTAVAIITEAILRLYFNRFEEAGQYLRLQVHDELLFEIIRAKWEEVNLIAKAEMEAPIKQMRMPASWGLGEYLNILTEAKIDLNDPSRWGSMRGIKD